MAKTRSTKCKLTSIEHGDRSTTVTIELKIPRYKGDDVNYEIKELKKNLKWLGPHLASWRGWDAAYTVELLIAGLRELGNRMLESDNHVNTTKDARRALFAAHRLERVACPIEWSMRDRSSNNRSNKLSHEDVPVRDGCIWWKPIFLGTNAMNLPQEDYHGKMSRVINKRIDREYGDELKETWAYIGKYVGHWWD